MLRVKICGIKTLKDALAAVEAGADMLGFNFYPPSPRYIDPQDCARLNAQLQVRLGENAKRIQTVGVFVNLPAEQVRVILLECGLDLAQLSGDEPRSDLLSLGDRAFKALRAAPGQSLIETSQAFPVREQPPAFLVDARVAGEYGGTGELADWGAARRLAHRSPVLLAGGLRPDNVAQAVEQVAPWGVDVASGVECAPGVKDDDKMRRFVQAARLKERM
jgi:phosphoribosylanthranilate isomerase